MKGSINKLRQVLKGFQYRELTEKDCQELHNRLFKFGIYSSAEYSKYFQWEAYPVVVEHIPIHELTLAAQIYDIWGGMLKNSVLPYKKGFAAEISVEELLILANGGDLYDTDSEEDEGFQERHEGQIEKVGRKFILQATENEIKRAACKLVDWYEYGTHITVTKDQDQDDTWNVNRVEYRHKIQKILV